jgi:hypothetical protein
MNPVYYKARALRLRRFRPEATLHSAESAIMTLSAASSRAASHSCTMTGASCPGRILVDIDCNNLNPRHPTLKGKCCEALC